MRNSTDATPNSTNTAAKDSKISNHQTDYRSKLIQRAIAVQALQFGNFTLKSGRISPYFFNIGALNSGSDLALLGAGYAQTIIDSKLEFDVLFGPAYKGIPLVTATAYALATDHQRNVPICYNRKETKQHGEGGDLIGAPLHGNAIAQNISSCDATAAQTSNAADKTALKIACAQLKRPRVLIIDDVLTKGTAVSAAIAQITTHGATPVGLIIAMDRQELGSGALSSSQEIQQKYAIPVYAILTITDIVKFCQQDPKFTEATNLIISKYQQEFCQR